MTETMPAVSPLHRVTLGLKARAEADASAPDPVSRTVSFVFGIGPQGLSPFESDLAEKRVGDTFEVLVEEGRGVPYFDHLARTVIPSLGLAPPFRLRVRVESTAPAEGREVVRAMAELAECGDGCDCGCGCGGGERTVP
jgi:hypothetical protein